MSWGDTLPWVLLFLVIAAATALGGLAADLVREYRARRLARAMFGPQCKRCGFDKHEHRDDGRCPGGCGCAGCEDTYTPAVP